MVEDGDAKGDAGAADDEQNGAIVGPARTAYRTQRQARLRANVQGRAARQFALAHEVVPEVAREAFAGLYEEDDVVVHVGLVRVHDGKGVRLPPSDAGHGEDDVLARSPAQGPRGVQGQLDQLAGQELDEGKAPGADAGEAFSPTGQRGATR